MTKKVIKNIMEFMSFLREADVDEKYITDAGKGFIDGLLAADIKYKPEFVERSKYEELKKELDREKSYKFKLFGLKF